MRQLDVIKSDSGSWVLSRQVRRSIEAHSRIIPKIRNATEHMEGDIRNETIIGKPIVLTISDNGDKAVLGEHEIKFSDVAIALRGLHHIAMELFEEKRDLPDENYTDC